MSDQQLERHGIAILDSGAKGPVFGGTPFEGRSNVTLIQHIDVNQQGGKL
jgi:hypothetical protein